MLIKYLFDYRRNPLVRPDTERSWYDEGFVEVLATRTKVQVYRGGMEITDLAQVPEACTLPTVEQPMRIAEFDRLFDLATAIEWLGPRQARIIIPSSPQIAAQAADLVVRETRCCSFFTFSLTASAGQLHLDVAVPESQVPVLEALVGRIERARGA